MKIAAAVIVLAASTASADVELYHPGGAILVRLDDDSGELAKVVGTSKKGPVRCYEEADNVEGFAGAGDIIVTGCFVGIARDGKLVAPTRFSFSHTMPREDGALDVVAKNGEVQLEITGVAANSLAMWIDCDTATKNDIVCDTDHAMAGKFGWHIVFAVGKGGVARPASF